MNLYKLFVELIRVMFRQVLTNITSFSGYTQVNGASEFDITSQYQY